MAKSSAGILAWRNKNGINEVLLVHPGGPFYTKKDEGVWSIPKGECVEGEDMLIGAQREFKEELGKEITGNFKQLRPVKQKGGKIVYAWAINSDIDTTEIKSNTFAMEWPPRSGKMQEFPEIDRAEWFTVEEAKKKINVAQTALLDELLAELGK